MRKWLRRLAATIESLSGFWLIGWSLYLAVEDEQRGNSVGDMLDIPGFILGPGLAGMAIAWAFEWFESPARKNVGRRV